MDENWDAVSGVGSTNDMPMTSTASQTALSTERKRNLRRPLPSSVNKNILRLNKKSTDT